MNFSRAWRPLVWGMFGVQGGDIIGEKQDIGGKDGEERVRIFDVKR